MPTLPYRTALFLFFIFFYSHARATAAAAAASASASRLSRIDATFATLANLAMSEQDWRCGMNRSGE